jgi:hypothetical protein
MILSCLHQFAGFGDGDAGQRGPPRDEGCPCPNCPTIEVKRFSLLRFDLGHVGLSHLSHCPSGLHGFV